MLITRKLLVTQLATNREMVNKEVVLDNCSNDFMSCSCLHMVVIVVISIEIAVGFMTLTYFKIKDNFIVDIIMNTIENINFMVVDIIN